MVPSQTALLQYYFLSHIDLTQNFISIPYGHNRKGLLQGLLLFEKYVHNKEVSQNHNKEKISLMFNSRLDATARKKTPCLLVVIPK